jgi:TctA family transporter
LGVVLGGMLEENFITSMIKANGDLSAFFARPIALSLAILSILVWTWPLIAKLWAKPSPSQMA